MLYEIGDTVLIKAIVKAFDVRDPEQPYRIGLPTGHLSVWIQESDIFAILNRPGADFSKEQYAGAAAQPGDEILVIAAVLAVDPQPANPQCTVMFFDSEAFSDTLPDALIFARLRRQ